MNIAILGAGNVGATLGRRFTELGHSVAFGVQTPEKYSGLDLAGPVSVVGEACSAADLVILALPFAAAPAALAECGDLSGKIVVDATNPVAMGDEGLFLTIGHNDSGAEQISKHAGRGKVVKCFNTTGFGNMAEPRGSMMFACGDDDEATETVRQLSDEIGFETINIGGLKQARLLEPLAMLWIHLAFTTDLKREFAFRISRG